jgi:hypothetical protein
MELHRDTPKHGDRAQMRQMISYPSDGPIEQFRCTECGWVFNLLTPDAPLEQREIAERWFKVHQCFAFQGKYSGRDQPD